MTWVIAAIVVVALGVAAVAATGGFGEMAEQPVRDVYRAALPDRPLGATDLSGLRFGVTLRGYAMGQVDQVLDRLRREIAARDAELADLRTRVPVTPAGVTVADAADERPADPARDDGAPARRAVDPDDGSVD